MAAVPSGAAPPLGCTAAGGAIGTGGGLGLPTVPPDSVPPGKVPPGSVCDSTGAQHAQAANSAARRPKGGRFLFDGWDFMGSC